MISAITSNSNKVNFRGTTIFKNRGAAFLNKEIIDAANESRPGFCQTIGDHTLLIVANVFKKQEDTFLKTLTKEGIDYNHSSKVLNYKNFSGVDLKLMIDNIVNLGLL